MVNIFTGGTGAVGSQVNTNFNETLNLSLKQAARQSLLGTTQTFSSDGTDLFADSFDEGEGINSSINMNNSTATYNSVDETFQSRVDNDEAAADTTHSVDTGVSWSNTADAFDNDYSTAASTAFGSTGVLALGKTFGAKTIKYVSFLAFVTAGPPTQSGTVTLQTYNGSVWSDVSGTATTYSVSSNSLFIGGTFEVDASVQGVRVEFNITAAQGSIQVRTLEYNTDSTLQTGYVELTIPTGTFSATVSKLQGTAIVSATESDAAINCKLLNGSEDSGWKPINEIGSFTAFTTEPTKAQFQLVLATTPTVGYPSIKAVAIKGWN
jgi:hypothetical protein